MFAWFMTALIFPKNLFQQLWMQRTWHYSSENDKIIYSACETNALPTFLFIDMLFKSCSFQPYDGNHLSIKEC